jgi:hypothetical protein
MRDRDAPIVIMEGHMERRSTLFVRMLLGTRWAGFCTHRLLLRLRRHLQIIDHILLARDLFGQAGDFVFLLIASHHAV